MYHYKRILETKSDRLISVDILRGLTIIFMIIVNNPGSWSQVYAPLLHAEWNGITPTDYIFPTFLFIVGVSIVLSISKKKKENPSKKLLLKKIIWRSIKIYLRRSLFFPIHLTLYTLQIKRVNTFLRFHSRKIYLSSFFSCKNYCEIW